MKTASKPLRLTFSTAAAFILGGVHVSAADLFEISANSASGLLSVGGKSLPDLVDNMINGTGKFQSLENVPFNAQLTYAGVNNALFFNVSDLGGGAWQAQLSSPFHPGLINRTFSGQSRAEVETQIQDYLKRDGLSDLARFLKAISEQSAHGTMVGNPNSTTALTANYSFTEYGMAMTETAEEKEDPKEATGVGMAMVGDVGFIKAQGIEANSYSFTPFLPMKLSSRVRLDIGVPMNYTEVGGAQVFRGGLQLAMPILVVKRNYKEGRPWLWQVTPHGGTQIAGSFDLVAGGVINSAGVTSLIAYDFGKFEISMGNHISFHESLEISIGDYTFDPQISNQIVKNGIKVGVPFAKRWYAEAYAIDTELLGSGNFMSRYTTLGGGVGYKFLGKADSAKKKKGYAMIGAYSNFGTDWTSANIQFGTGWKF